LLDPYWRNGRLENSWTTNHPAYVDLGSASDTPAAMTQKILKNVITFADTDPGVSFVVSHYDTSRTPDGSTLGQSYGDANQAQRDITAITYLQASWINRYGKQHHLPGAPPREQQVLLSVDLCLRTPRQRFFSQFIGYADSQ
jgi:hypothetical protein